ncbi:hypothetical protein OEZ86_010993 [Tetradesmus obliquus]|nr:hypothetical protein OEZ86_010993 [Tetradesmus obliquus]
MQYTVGLISDSHAVFDKAAAEAFKHTNLIIHAGDVGHHGRHREVLQLYAEATGVPLLAIAGNVDGKLDAADRQLLPQHRLVQAAGWKLLVCHIVAPGPTAKVDAAAAALIHQLQPDIVVCGHSHKACCWQADGVSYINPGSAGPARFKLPRTVALLQLPFRTAAAAAVAAGDSGQPNGGKGVRRDNEASCSIRPTAAMCTPGTHIEAAKDRSDSSTNAESKRTSRRRVEAATKTVAERLKDACTCTEIGNGGGEAAAPAAEAAFAGSSKDNITSDAWLGQLHVGFVQLPQKGPPRLAA